MKNTLEKKSGILRIKSKFFLYRALSYFSFLLIPIWLPKSLEIGTPLQCLMMVFYILFMVGQWFLLGKEIDYRLKIYYRVNSSIDRVIYRFLIGMMFIILYFNLLSLLPDKWIYNLFWVTWAFLGLFYSWPTRGKIIRESVSSNFTEFRYLDSFEKTLVGLILLLFIFSIPELPSFTNIETLKLTFDPFENFSEQLWNFLTINYFPFKKYPVLFKLAWSMHFYFVGGGFFLLIFYSFLRYFVSRRLSLLGVFALLSSWSFSKIIAGNYGEIINTTYSLLWVWSILWVTKSSTYRSGLFIGLVGYLGSIINQSYALLSIIHMLLLYFVFLKDKTLWFRRQLIKYAFLGVSLSLLILFTHYDSFETLFPLGRNLLGELIGIINRKAFYSLSLFGLIIILLKVFMPKLKVIDNLKLDEDKLRELLILFALLVLYGFIFDYSLIKSFSLMWPIAFLSLVPIELLFQTISRLRSSRNMIYLIYILICLLDSHFEGRVKIFLRLFNA